MNITFYSHAKDIDAWLDEIRAHLPGAVVWAWSPETADRQADYALVWAPPPALFASQRALKAIFNLGAGVDALLLTPSLPRDVPVVRINDGGMAVQMAEYVCHALIRHVREFEQYETQARSRLWNPRRPIDRARWPVGIMGLGAIGRRVAEAVVAFEYPVMSWSRTPHALPGVVSFAGAEGLEPFLRSTRVLVCVLPLTPQTDGILNADNLGRLMPDAYLINVARGRHLVETDLLALLDRGILAGATLDVVQSEPLAPAHPFWQHAKITLTPHISARTLRGETVAQIADKIHCLERGEPIDGIVDLTAGY
jgi:glyoxylate/hydroxypyruvate reductase A